MATAKKMSKAEKIRTYQARHPDATADQVSKATGADIGYIYAIRHKDKDSAAKTPKVNPWKKAVAVLEGVARLEAANRFADAQHITMIEPPADNVNHPSHYKVGGIETIDFIEAKQLSYHLGNVVKYIARADSKGNRKEDLLKAQWYLNREIAKFDK
jgi:prolyl-tRNA editing enzyme YbaK/EbsC (Cys-tRNA(Pro) deacylase)